jgi:hypothetical protein
LLKIKTCGSKWKKQIDKTNDWAAWQWVNPKIDKKKSYIAQTNCKHFQGGYGRLPSNDVDTCHGFLPRIASLKQWIPKQFFTSLLKDLLTEDLVTFRNLLSTKFMEPNRQLHATPSKQP